jgi:hypothetical protein
MAAAAGAAAVLGLLAVVLLSRQMGGSSSEVSMLSNTDLVMPPSGVGRAGLENSEFTWSSSLNSCMCCWEKMGDFMGKSRDDVRDGERCYERWRQGSKESGNSAYRHSYSCRNDALVMAGQL